MQPINEIFYIEYGNQFDFSKMECTDEPSAINFISRGSTNNGFVSKVQRYKDTEPYPAGLITVTMGGSYLLASFVQPAPFYTAQNIKVLRPKYDMSLAEKLFYCAAIQHNRFRYHSHAREANSTFDTIIVPSPNEIPKSFLNSKISPYDVSPLSNSIINLDTSNWQYFRFKDIFEIRKGFYNKKPEHVVGGSIPFIGATDSNNGITSYCDIDTIEKTSKTGDSNNAPLSEKLFKSDCITVSNNGSIGFAFFQSQEFTCSHDVNPLYLLDRHLNIYIAMFLCTVIELERYRWAYGRKWRPARMPESLIKLPVTPKGKPDWDFMESFIQSRPYSKLL